MTFIVATSLFPLGHVCITPGANDLDSEEVLHAFLRHSQGDWGDLDSHDVAENKRALEGGGRLFSQYKLSDDSTIWIITEADRSVTTILLPSEY